MKGQSSNGTASGTGTSSAATSAGGLINCSVKPFVDLKHIKKEGTSKTFTKFKDSLEEVYKYLNEKNSDDEFKKQFSIKGDIPMLKPIYDAGSKLKESDKPDDDAKAAWKTIKTAVSNEPMLSIYKKDKDFKKKYEALKKAWEAWSGTVD